LTEFNPRVVLAINGDIFQPIAERALSDFTFDPTNGVNSVIVHYYYGKIAIELKNLDSGKRELAFETKLNLGFLQSSTPLYLGFTASNTDDFSRGTTRYDIHRVISVQHSFG